MLCVGRESSVGIANSYELEGRIQVGARFSATVQTGPGAHPASYTIGAGFFSRVKQSERCVGHPPLSSAEAKERVKLHIYFLSRP
jgi:hypothetical protein